MSDTVSLPGDEIASIEEYEAGENTFDDGDKVRSTVVGITEIDKKQRIASIKNPKQVPVPNIGDIVIGTVAAVLSSMIAVSIKFINGNPVTSGVECVCSTRNLRKKSVTLANDIVKLKIISHLNGTIHASISEPELGILFTKCRRCGMKVIQLRDAVKCTECGWIDEKKLASDFGNNNIINDSV
jgi:exosome complex component CSL4